MNADLTTILSNDTTISAISALLDTKDANNSSTADQVTALKQKVADLTGQNEALASNHASDVTNMQRLSDQHTADLNTIQTVQKQLSDAITAEQAEDAAEKAAPVAVVFDKLERTPWILAGGTLANTNTTGSTAVSTQGQAGATSAWFNLAPNGAWADAYFYKTLGADASKHNFIFEQSFLFPTPTDSAASNCVELDIQQVIGGNVYNGGWQFDFTENSLRVWNRSGKTWVATGKPCPRWTAGQWVDIKVETHRDDTTFYHDAITINGVRTPINMSFPLAKLPLGDMLNCAIQLDGNKAGTPYRLCIDNVRFTKS